MMATLAATILSAAGTAQPEQTATSTTAHAAKPNIIFVLSDDVGIANIGCYGSDSFRTPRIDALAKTGIRYTHCLSTPLCGPSRATILTGRYSFRTGMIGNQFGSVVRPENEIMIPKVLKPAGYVTAHVGKWNQIQLEPGDWGFDESLKFAGSGKYWRKQQPTYLLNGKPADLPEGKYLPDVMHEFLVDFMTRHKDQPFYVHYAMSHMHGPILQTADNKPGSKDLYAENVAYMDKLVGQLVDELERLKLRERTFVVFVGDNGTARFGADRMTIGGRRISGMKGTLLEGGSRVPRIVSWPGSTPAGKVSDDLVDFTDFMPTFAELAGARLPESVTIDGQSFAARAQGRPGVAREWAYTELNGKWYVRSARWKLNRAGELFDMKDAPFVEAPVAATTTDTLAVAARGQLQSVLDRLNPAAGKQAPAEGKKAGKRQLKAGKKGSPAKADTAGKQPKKKRAARRAERKAALQSASQPAVVEQVTTSTER